MSEQLMELPVTEAFQPTVEIGGAVGRTVLELLARPVEAYDPIPLEGRQPTSQPSQQRTWNPQANQPDSQPDVVWD